MRDRERIVVDSNALISRLLLPDSVPGRAVNQAVDCGVLLVSEATMNELAEVLARRKLDRYISLQDRQEFLLLLGRIAEMVSINHAVRACRDPEDDKFLELAINGAATLVITGDHDLLHLHPFRGIPILSPADYLAR